MDDKQKRLFLYTDAAALYDLQIEAVIAAGYVPVRVGALSEVQILEPGISIDVDGATLNAMGAAAMQAIMESTEDWPRERFAANLLAIVTRKTRK